MGTILLPISKINTFLGGVFGEIHTHDNSTPQSIPNGTTYTKLINFTDNGLNNGVTCDNVNGELTVLTEGYYQVDMSMSVSSGTSNVTLFAGVFLDEVEQDNIHFERKIAVAADKGSAGSNGKIYATAGQKISLRVRHNDGSPVNITPIYCNLNCTLLKVV